MSDVRRASSLNAPPTRARAKNKALGEVKCLSERFSCRLRSVFRREGHSMRTVRQTKRAVTTRSRGAAYFNSPQFLSRSKTTRRFNADSYDISDRDGDCSPHQIWLPRADTAVIKLASPRARSVGVPLEFNHFVLVAIPSTKKSSFTLVRAFRVSLFT